MVIAVPAPCLVEGRDEEVGPFQVCQGLLAVAAAGDGVAEGAREPVEDGRLDQEGLQVLRQALQHLLDQVVEDVAMAAGEVGDQLTGVLPALQGEGGQLQAGGPALGAGLQGRKVRRCQLQAHAAGELAGLVGGEAQVGGAHLGQLPARPQPGQGQGRVGAGDEEEAQRGRHPVEEEGHAVVDSLIGDPVVVVDGEEAGLRLLGQLVDQGDQPVSHPRRRRPQQGGGVAAGLDPQRQQGGDAVAPEADGVAVRLVQGDPGGAQAIAGLTAPLADQGGLAETGGGTDQDELAGKAGAEAPRQALARHEPGPGRG